MFIKVTWSLGPVPPVLHGKFGPSKRSPEASLDFPSLYNKRTHAVSDYYLLIFFRNRL